MLMMILVNLLGLNYTVHSLLFPNIHQRLYALLVIGVFSFSNPPNP